jgi:hypothetical protein
MELVRPGQHRSCEVDSQSSCPSHSKRKIDHPPESSARQRPSLPRPPHSHERQALNAEGMTRGRLRLSAAATLALVAAVRLQAVSSASDFPRRLAQASTPHAALLASTGEPKTVMGSFHQVSSSQAVRPLDCAQPLAVFPSPPGSISSQTLNFVSGSRSFLEQAVCNVARPLVAVDAAGVWSVARSPWHDSLAKFFVPQGTPTTLYDSKTAYGYLHNRFMVELNVTVGSLLASCSSQCVDSVVGVMSLLVRSNDQSAGETVVDKANVMEVVSSTKISDVYNALAAAVEASNVTVALCVSSPGSCPLNPSDKVAVLLPIPPLKGGALYQFRSAVWRPGLTEVRVLASPPGPSLRAPALGTPTAPAASFHGTGTKSAPLTSSVVQNDQATFARTPEALRSFGVDTSALVGYTSVTRSDTQEMVLTSVPVQIPRDTGGMPPMCIVTEVALDGRLWDACRQPGFNCSDGYAWPLGSAPSTVEQLAPSGSYPLIDQMIDLITARPTHVNQLPWVDLQSRSQGAPLTSSLPWQNLSSARVSSSAYDSHPFGTGSGATHLLPEFLTLSQSLRAMPPRSGTYDVLGNLVPSTPGVRSSWVPLACFRPRELAALQETASSARFLIDWIRCTGNSCTSDSSFGEVLSPTTSSSSGVLPTFLDASGKPLDGNTHQTVFGAGQGSTAWRAIKGFLPGAALDPSLSLTRWLRADPAMSSAAVPVASPQGGLTSSATSASSGLKDILATIPNGFTTPVSRARPLPATTTVHVPLLLEASSAYRIRFRVVASEMVETPAEKCSCALQSCDPNTAPLWTTTSDCVANGGSWNQTKSRLVQNQVWESPPSPPLLVITPAVAPTPPEVATLMTKNASSIRVSVRPSDGNGGCALDTLEVHIQEQDLSIPSSSFSAANESHWSTDSKRLIGFFHEEPGWRDDWLVATLFNNPSAAPASGPFPLPFGAAASTSPFMSDLSDSRTFVSRSLTWGFKPWAYGLRRYTWYRVTHRLHNDVGWSLPSSAFLMRTDPLPPSPPLRMSFVPEWNLAVQLGVRFIAPLDTGGPPISSYYRRVTANGTALSAAPVMTVYSAPTSLAQQWSAAEGLPLDTRWLVSNITDLVWATRYTVEVFARTTLSGESSPPIQTTTASPLECSPRCVPSTGTCHDWNGQCICLPGWKGEICQQIDGSLVIYRLTIAAGSVLVQSGMTLVGGNTERPTVSPTEQAEATTLIASPSATPSSIDAAVTIALGGGQGISIVGQAFSSIMAEVQAMTSQSMASRVSIFSARLTNAASLVSGASASGTLTLALRVAPDSQSSTSEQQIALLLSDAADLSTLSGMGVTHVIRPANLGGGSGSVRVVAAPPCPMTGGATSLACSTCTQSPSCGYCASRDICRPGTARGLAIGAPPCPAVPLPLGADGTGSSQITPLSLKNYFHTQSPTASTCLPLCSSLSGCDSCTVRADCRFCRSSSLCQSIHTLGLVDIPRIGNGVCPFSFLSDDILFCPSRRCPKRSGTNRAFCVADESCGWCAGHLVTAPSLPANNTPLPTEVNVCVEGNSFGPYGARCEGEWFFRNLVSCTELGETAVAAIVTDNDVAAQQEYQNAEVCKACVAQKVGCGFCDATGTCVTATGDGTAPALGTCATGWVSPLTPGICPVRELTPREICQSKSSCTGCLGVSYCSWCETEGALGECVLDLDRQNVLAGGVAQGSAASQCRAASSYSQLLRQTCMEGCTAISALPTAMSGTLQLGSIVDLQRPTSLSYSAVSRCAWSFDPRPLTSTIRSVGKSTDSDYDPSTLPTVYAVVEAVDLGRNDVLVFFDGPNPSSGNPIVTIKGSSSEGASAKENSLILTWSSSYGPSDPSQSTEIPSGGLFVFGTKTGVMSAQLVGVRAHLSSRALRFHWELQQDGSRQLLAQTLDDRGGSGEAGLPLGFRVSFSTVVGREVDVYFVIGVIIVSVIGMCAAAILVSRFRRWRRIRMLLANGFDADDEFESFQDTAARARAEGTSTPGHVVASFPAFVYQLSTRDQTPLKDFSEEDLACPITLEPFEDGKTVVRVLSCKHAFTRGSLDDWLKVNRVCPMCKEDVVEMFVKRQTAVETGTPDLLALGPDVVRWKPPKVALSKEPPPGSNPMRSILASASNPGTTGASMSPFAVANPLHRAGDLARRPVIPSHQHVSMVGTLASDHDDDDMDASSSDEDDEHHSSSFSSASEEEEED